jgi:hypothetical protein
MRHVAVPRNVAIAMGIGRIAQDQYFAILKFHPAARSQATEENKSWLLQNHAVSEIEIKVKFPQRQRHPNAGSLNGAWTRHIFATVVCCLCQQFS